MISTNFSKKSLQGREDSDENPRRVQRTTLVISSPRMSI